MLPDSYLRLCEKVYSIHPEIVWKMLFVYPHEDSKRCTPKYDIDSSFHWSRMPEGPDFWCNLNSRIEGLGVDEPIWDETVWEDESPSEGGFILDYEY